MLHTYPLTSKKLVLLMFHNTTTDNNFTNLKIITLRQI